MHVKELWRYPVKSMRGERLLEAEIALDGIIGDRVIHAENERDLITARTHPRLLGFAATTEHGAVRVEGTIWRDPRVGERVRTAVGADVRLVASDASVRFDVMPLLVATDGAIAAFGHDGRRLRPNIVVAGVAGLAERNWEGLGMMIGPVAVYLHSLRQRCVLTTYDPDTLAKDGRILREIYRRFDGVLALNAAVIRPGVVSVGESVSLLTKERADEIWREV